MSTLTRLPTGFQITGTAVDPDAAGAVTVQIYAGTVLRGSLQTSNSAYSGVVPVLAGTQRVCAVAVNRNKGANTQLGCRTITVSVNPFGNVEQVTANSAGLRVRGWALDPDTTAPIMVHVYVDGHLARAATIAALSRPDVGSAYQLYGATHGYDITLPAQRHSKVCVTAVNVGAGTSTSLGCGREKDAFSIFTLNLGGTNDEVPWRERVDRLAAMSGTGNVPDVINLQDVHVLKIWAPFQNADPATYEMLFELIARLKARIGADYRIAYLSTEPTVMNGLSPVIQGMAVLYNSETMRNTTTTPLGNTATVPDSDYSVVGPHLRRSFQCGRAPAPRQYVDSCGLLDGEGIHFSSPDWSSNRWSPGAQAVLFEPTSDPGKHIMVVNVHAHPHFPFAANDQSLRAITDVVSVAGRAWAQVAKLYPPIIAGDFNFGAYELWDATDPGGQLANYQPVGNTGVDNILVGRSASFSSTRLPMASSNLALPDPDLYGACRSTYATRFSDHCALYTQFVPKT